MVPCPWFPEMVDLAKQHPALDVGVHLTLTSESRACRWRPISTTSRKSGLFDGDGYMWPDVPSVRRHADRAAVETELRAQIEAALGAGLDVTHLDTHMGAAAAPEFAGIYLALGREYRLPVLIPRQIVTYLSVLDLGPVDRASTIACAEPARGEGTPLIDRFAMGLAMRHRTCGRPTARSWSRPRSRGSPTSRCTAARPARSSGCIRRCHTGGSPSISCSTTGFPRVGPAQDVRLIGFRAIRDLYRERPAGA